MRRSRFVRAIRPKEAEKASIKEALWFDLRAAETTDDASLSDWRVTGLEHFAVLLGVTHLLITATCLLLSSSLFSGGWLQNPLVPAALVLVLDAGAAAALFMRNRVDLAPHTIVRGLCLYLVVGGVLWTWFGHAVADDVFLIPIAAAPIAMSAGIAMGAIVTINAPPLALTNAVVSAFAAIMLASSPLITVGVEIISMVLVAYSIAGARSFIATARKRLRLEAQARKAQQFVDEFENSGRGWFWETDSLGTLSYVSQQLADDFHQQPEVLLGRSFTDLLSVDSQAADSLE